MVRNNKQRKIDIIGYRRGAGGVNSQAGMRGRMKRKQNELGNESNALALPKQNELNDDPGHGEAHTKTIGVAAIHNKKVEKENVEKIEIASRKKDP